MCFDTRVKKEVLLDVQLLAYLMDFNTHKESSRNKRIKKNIFGILWLGTSYLQDKSIFNKKSNDKKKPSKKKNENIENESSRNLIESWHSDPSETLNTSNAPRNVEPINLEANMTILNKKEIQNTDNEIDQEIKRRSTTSLKQTGHIMISYNKESRELCLKVKRELEIFGFKIWIGKFCN